MNAVVETGAPSAVTSKIAALRAAEAGNPNSFDGAPAAPATPTPSTADTGPQPVGVVTTQPATPQPATPPQTPEGERITLTRQEYNDLRADAQRAVTADGKAQTLQLSLEELQHRLTALEKGGNAEVAPPAPRAPASPGSGNLDWNTTQEEYTTEEQREYEQSASYIDKRARNIVRAELAPFVDKLNAILANIGQKVDATSGSVQTVQRNTFQSELLKLAPDYKTLIADPNWRKFVDAIEPMTRRTYGDVLGYHLGQGDPEGAATVYKAFRDQYYTPQTSAAAFVGVTPGGGGEVPDAPAAPTQKLKFSERKKLSDDYKFGRITYDKLQEFNKKWAEAEANGNIDYNA